MTEAVSQGQPIVSIPAEVRPSWRNSTNSTLNDQPSFKTRRHASLPASVPSIYVTSITMADPLLQKHLKEKNCDSTAAKYIGKFDNSETAGTKKLKNYLIEEPITAEPSASDVSLSVNVSSPKKNHTGEIRWQNFEDEEDEETSEDYDDEEVETEEEDDENKPGVSDTETQNLLDEVEGDGESDGEDLPDNGHISKSLKECEGQPEPGIWKKEKVMGKRSRRQLIILEDTSLFEMSEQQKEYYTRCFKYLMKLTVGHFDLNGAVHGANEHVVEFFKKSDLDTDTLSKIWALSDVNEDGYLNHAEFSTAMHLIVLNVKGNIAIPDILPKCIRPPMTPVRIASQNVVNALTLNTESGPSSDPIFLSNVSESNIAASDDKKQTAKTPLGWRQFDYDDPPSHSVQQQHSLSDDHLHIHFNRMEAVERLSDFSDVPPLLVDSRPTAVKPTKPLNCSIEVGPHAFRSTQSGTDILKNALSPQAPKGPPPKPPPRPPNKGHGRSASLDLNPLSNLSACFGTYKVPSSITQPDPTTVLRTCGYSSNVPYVDPVRVTAPSIPQGIYPNLGVISSSSARSPVAAPPLPPRPVVADAEVQTEGQLKYSSKEEPTKNTILEPKLIEFNDDMEKRIKELVEKESLSTRQEEGLQVNWKERCAQLKKLNAELENERAKLAQIRLQLEVRLQELTPGTSSALKPTVL